jgi:histidyl-tRNA synthetase
LAKFQAPKGTRDFYPEQAALRNWIVEHWRRVSLRNGFVEYDGPTFEHLDLYRVKSGEEIVSQLFHFTDRGGRELALRPEMTPTLARMVAARAQGLPKPIRWFCTPAMYRAERPQRGRLREFLQWNIDILGEDDLIADADCIFVLIDLFRDLGLKPDQVEVKINSRALLASVLRTAGFPDDGLEPVYAVLDKRDKLPDEVFSANVETIAPGGRQKTTLLALGQAKGAQGLESIRAMIGSDEEGLRHHESLVHVLALLECMGVGDYCVFDMSVVRGLAYYTGTVFEAFGKGSLQRAICGGGRYDKLLAGVGGPPLSGVGFGLGDVIIQDVLTEFSMLPDDLGKVETFFVIDADPALFDRLLAVVAELRRRGVPTVFSYKRQPFVKQLRQASSRGAARVVIVDRDTADRDRVAVKDLGTGAQESFPLAELLEDPYRKIEAAT